MTKHFRCFIALLLALLLFNSTTALACGPISLEAIFVFTVHPGYPLDRFAAGRLGVVQPTYARSYIYVAYRHLSGSSFTADEQKAVTQLWKERLEYQWSAGDEDWTKRWLEARQKVVSQDPAPISVYRNREKPDEYESYLNCQQDSFETAIATLNERIAKYGAESAPVRTWLEAQDQVFSNCGGGSVIPAQLPADADALMRADRAYQMAAAHFYAANFDEVRKGFEAISADANSPWQRNAVYLVARVFARKASLGAPEQKEESLRQAEAQLQKILADKNLASLHVASTRLLNLVRLRLDPAKRLNELAQILTTKTPNGNLKQDLTDYTVLLDRYLETDEGDPAQATSPKGDDLSNLKREDLSDWIATFQDSSDGARDHALAKWQASRSMPWLIAALTAIDGKHAKASELTTEALKVKSNSAAFASARFHAIRLLIDMNRTAEARPLLDQSLTTDRAHFDESALNLLISQRMLLATSLSEFLRDATRIPATLSYDDDGREIPADESWLGEPNKDKRGKPFFDVDAAHALNQHLPLSVLKEAVKSNALPAGPRRDLTQATWLRAALLGDTKTADELAPILAKLVPEAAELLNKYAATTGPEEKKYAAIYAWLKTPGLEPIVDAGLGREAPLHQQDVYRDNWWCTAATEFIPVIEKEGREARPFTATSRSAPSFLSPAELQKGENEWKSLRAFGASPNYLSQQVIAWANSHPTDPRVPEALHLAVRTTRYGCTDKESARWSKAAFDVLHRKYPTSTWAKKTPYWFKD
ncbi:MAG: hypothetical protein LC794_01155 [Acidobacteria bacterium]|nr:hypothetical protein [Acidobacteriota bacterium]